MINKTGRMGKMFSSYGLAQIPLLIGLLIMAIAVPVATKLVEENQDTRNLAATCIPEGEIVYSGATCCVGLIKTGCVSAGTFSYCYCTKPVVKPTSTPTMKNCTFRTCTSSKCESKTQSVSSNQACPASNCTTEGAACGGVLPTAVPTQKPTVVPTASPTCGALGQSCCLQEYVGSTPIYNKCNADLYCNTGKCGTTPVPTATAPCNEMYGRDIECYCENPVQCSSNKCTNNRCVPFPTNTPVTPNPTMRPTVTRLPTLTPTPIIVCSSITNATECGYTPGCYYYDKKCTNVKPTIGLVTLTPIPSGVVVTGGPIVTKPPVVTSGPTNVPVPGNTCKEVLTGNMLQCCHPPDSDGTTNDSLCNRAGRVTTCGGKDYCCPTLNGNWTTDMSKCNLKCSLCANGKNRSIGDADCNGVVDVNDRSIWSSEFVSDGGRGTVKNNWMSDFDCNGVVDVNDRSIWSANFKI